MKINSLSSYSVSFFKENFFLQTLNPQHLKIIKIVSAALLFFVVCYTACRCLKIECWTRVKSLIKGKDDKKIPEGKKEEEVEINNNKNHENKEAKEEKVADDKLKEEQLNPQEEQKLPYESLIGDKKINGYEPYGKVKFTSLNGDLEFDYSEMKKKNKFINGKGKLVLEFSEIEKKNKSINDKEKLVMGVIAEGEFQNGDLHRGKIICNTSTNVKEAEGTFDINSFKEGPINLLHQGRKVYVDGKIEVGEFYNDKLHGEGRITLANGDEKEGIFENGILVEAKKLYLDKYLYNG